MSAVDAVPAVDPAGAHTEILAGAVLVDVREPYEYAAGHVADSVNIPLGSLPQHRNDIPAGRRVVCVCRSGNRSAQATAYLRDSGADAVNLTGGVQAWHLQGQPLVTSHGGPGTVA